MRTAVLAVFLACGLWADTVAGLRWTPPAGWQSKGASPMRAATYIVPAGPGDREGGECVVYFFGAGQGGGVEANIKRWEGQMRQPGGKPAVSKPVKRTIAGLPVTTIDISGEYTGMGGPMAVNPSAKPGYRMLGAIVEGPGGNVFLKFTGPAATVKANQSKFEQMLQSFEKGSK